MLPAKCIGPIFLWCHCAVSCEVLLVYVRHALKDLQPEHVMVRTFKLIANYKVMMSPPRSRTIP